MNNSLLSSAYYFLGTSLVIVFAVLLVAAFFSRRPALNLALGLLVLFACFLVPVRWASAFVFVGSAVGTLSASFYVLCGFGLVALFTERRVVRAQDEAVCVGLISVLGLLLYATYLGFIPLPVYKFGFQMPIALILPVLGLLVGALFRSYMTLTWIVSGLLIWLLSLQLGRNLWDVFIDPLGVIAALVLSLAHFAAFIGKPINYRGLRMSSRP